MVNPIRRFYGVEYMAHESLRRGDMITTREAYKNLISIAVPSVAEMVLMSLIGSIDTMMVGSLGTAAIAAVGLVGQPRMLFLCMFFALNTGVTAIVARRKGEGNQAGANRTLRNAVLIALGLSLFLTFIAQLFARQLMGLAGAKADTIDAAETYFRIIMWSLPINAVTMCINAAHRGVGDTKITMYVNITANLVNVVCNYLLIGGNLGFPRMGVAGAALASVIGLVVGFFLCLFVLLRKKKNGQPNFLHISRGDSWRFDSATVKGIAKIGGNAMIEQIALRIGFFTYARIVADLGTNAFAAHQICMQFLNLSFTFGDGLGIAGTSLVGQMLGKKRPDLSMIYGKCSQRLAFTIAVILASSICLLRYPLISLFMTPPQNTPLPLTATGADLIYACQTVFTNADVYATAARVMFMVALFQPFQTSAVVFSGCLRGAGDTKYVAMIMILTVSIMRPILSLVAIHVLGLDLVGAWSASLLDMMTRMTLSFRRFSSGKWSNIKV